MVKINNKEEFNNSKQEKEIKIERNRNFRGQLVIEDYSELENLYLRDVKKVDKITLKNLPQLQECTIWNCDTNELIVEKCPQIKQLNIRQNNLVNLEFLANLENLEELEIDGNSKLSKILEPYNNDWKAYQKDLQDSDKNTLELLRNIRGLEKEKNDLTLQLELSQQKYENLKKFLKETLVSLSKDNQEELVNELNNEIETRETNISSVDNFGIKTAELTSSLRLSVEEIKEVKKELETNLTESEKKIQELEKELTEAKSRAEQRKRKVEGLGDLVVQTAVYEKTIEFLKTKSSFLNARRETIEELQKCFNKWDKFGRRILITSTIGDTISSIGGSITNVITFGIPKAVGEAIKSSSNFSKIIVADKGNKELQVFLADERELAQLNSSYDALIDLIRENEEVNNLLDLKTRRLRDGKAKLFNKKYEIFDILTSDGVWKERCLGIDKMEVTIKSLTKNLKEELELEWEEQFDKLKLNKKYKTLIIKEQQIQVQIQQIQSNLKELIISARDKLESKGWFVSDDEKKKKNDDRKLLLDNLLNAQIEIVRSGDTTDRQDKLFSLRDKLLEIASEHDHKEFKELDNLCQIQIELTKLQIELENLKEQQAQTEIPPKGLNKWDMFQQKDTK